MLKKILVVAVMSVVATSSFAAGYYATREAKEVAELKDGSTVYVFNDGKMAMESKYGRAIRMDPGTVMVTKDGRKITMVGDESARLENLLWLDYRGRR